MHIRHFLGCIIAGALATAPLANAIPNNGPVSTTYQSSFFYVSFSGDGGWLDLSMSSRNVVGTTPIGDLTINSGNGISDFYIECSGPSIAQALSVNAGNGSASVQVILDPTNPDPSAISCFSYNVEAPVSVDLSAKPDGNEVISVHGNGTVVSNGGAITQHSSEQTDNFSEAVSGSVGTLSVPGPPAMVFASAGITRGTVLTQSK